MVKFIKRYWDLLGGVSTGLILSYISNFQLEPIQLIYSIIILVLVCIGLFKIIRQSIEKRPKKRNTLVDTLVDGQKPIKAISLATNPTREGETLGKLILEIMRGTKNKMKKIKVYFDRFKGFMLSIALTILSIVEQCGGFINDLCDGKLAINGIEILPIITLLSAVVVGCVSNGYTKEQLVKIKALFSKSTCNELVQVEIKKNLKENKAKLIEFNKIKNTQETALENLENQLTTAKNSLEAKRQMFNMIPKLATEEDITLASNEVDKIQSDINIKKQELLETNNTIENLTSMINALQTQL